MARTGTKNDKADISRDKILSAAAELFKDKGFASVSLRAIAAAAGMKAGSVYYHFESKEKIITEILNLGISVVYDEVEKSYNAISKTATASELIKAAAVSHLRGLFEFSHYTSANVRIFGQVPQEVRNGNLEVRREYEKLWDRILQTAKEKGELRADADLKAFRLMLIGSLNATLEWFDPEKGKIEDLAERYANILLNGVLK